MSRDDDTPELRPPGKRRPDTQWGDTRRIAVGEDRRKADGTSSESRRSQQRRSAVIAVPQRPLDDEITEPHEIFERDLSQSQLAIIQRSRRDSSDPATYADVVRLADTLTRARQQEKSNNDERDQQLATLLGSKPGDMLERFRHMEASVKSHNRLVKAGFAIALASITAVGTFLYTRGLSEGANATRINYMERSLDRAIDRIDRIEGRRSQTEPAANPVALTTTKDTP